MCHEIVSILKDKDASAVIFMKLNDSCASDEDSANENNGCLIDNFPGSQLNAPAEALLSDGRRIKICQTDRNNKSIDAEQIYKQLGWKHSNLLLVRNPVYTFLYFTIITSIWEELITKIKA